MSVLKEQAETLIKKIESNQKINGKDEIKPFRKKFHSIIEKNHEKLYNKIMKKVGDTMKNKENYDKLCNQ